MSARDARPRRRAWRAALEPAVLIALAGCWLTVSQWAGARPLWLDEEMIALNVRDRSFADLAGQLWLDQSAPLGWLVLERTALLAFGTGELALRLIPMIFGIATLAAAVWIGLRWMSRIGASVLALLCTFGVYLSHYPQEVKHYSADGFFGLLLPALAVWAVESDGGALRRRALVWWTLACVGQWLANGAVFVTPGCAALLLVIVWRRDGLRAALRFAQVGAVWIASIGLHYYVSLRYTHNSAFLRSHWASELPLDATGPIETSVWIVNRLEPLATNPAGTDLWIVFWLLAACGFALSSRPVLGAAFATAPMSAFLLAAFRLVPLHQRFSLWMVPALYAGVALILDRAIGAARRLYLARRWMPLCGSVAVVLTAVYLCTDVVANGARDLTRARPREHKQGLDDRSAVQWLMARRQPGDAILTTRLGWPSVWWYAGIDLSRVNGGWAPFSDGSRMFEVAHVRAPADCAGDQVREALKDHQRALVYLGFRDVPDGFGDLLLSSLDRMGVVAAFLRFADLSFTAIVDLHGPGSEQITFRSMIVLPEDSRTPLDGCVSVRPASRW
ncbi:MAG TPA: hypothetical protein VES67_17410 [Vicinamibacterales bacterium]|nr:hypothetical protein [Vicinamibacterales bacterium]